MLNTATPDQLLAIVEIGSNVLKCPEFCLTNRQRSCLLPHATFVRQLAQSRTPLVARRIIQKGGGFGAISSLLIPVLFELSRSLLSKNTSS